MADDPGIEPTEGQFEVRVEWTPVQTNEQKVTVQGAIYQALGAASTCWDDLESAKAIGDTLMNGLESMGVHPDSPWPT